MTCCKTSPCPQQSSYSPSGDRPDPARMLSERPDPARMLSERPDPARMLSERPDAARMLSERPDPARMLSAKLYDMYHCCVYSVKLLLMDRGTVRNM